MLQDLMAGRKTEIEVLCGAVVSRGKELGIATPRNEILMALVRGIEMSQHYD
jgi:2-dehydropantoate 2-reductase